MSTIFDMYFNLQKKMYEAMYGTTDIWLAEMNERSFYEVVKDLTKEGIISNIAKTQKANELGIVLKLPHYVGEDEAGDKLHKDCFVVWRDFFLGSDGYVRPCMSTPIHFFEYDKAREFMDMWNAPEYQRYRKNVNHQLMMDNPCTRCYQSSHCNWNRKESWIQVGEQFSPDWE